jgi:hypothetical protein
MAVSVFYCAKACQLWWAKFSFQAQHWNGQSRLQRSAISDVKGKMIPKRAFEDVSLLMSDKTAQFEPIFDNKCSF